MKLKLDENLGARAAEVCRAAGHEVATVRDERLSAATDERLIEVCRLEGRCLVTLDLDFGNPLRFRPADFAGIAVLRLPARPAQADLVDALRTLLAALDRAPIAGKLWIAEAGRIREYQPET